MNSYFANPLFTKYKAGDTLRPSYYDCRLAPDAMSGRQAVFYGAGGAAGGGAPPGFEHPAGSGAGTGGAPGVHHQEFYHNGSSAAAAAAAAYQAAGSCALDAAGNFYGYPAFPRQPVFALQQECGGVVQYPGPDFKSFGPGAEEEAEYPGQGSSSAQLFPWMRSQAGPFIKPDDASDVGVGASPRRQEDEEPSRRRSRNKSSPREQFSPHTEPRQAYINT